MILLIDLNFDRSDPYGENTRKTLEQIAGDSCVSINFADASLDEVRKAGSPWAVCYSGGRGGPIPFEVDGFRELVLNLNVPQFGFCRGYQHMAVVLGAKINYMRKLRDGEEDVMPEASGGRKMEYGLCQVNTVTDHFLFRGLPKQLDVAQFHSLELTALGTELELLAESDECPIQGWAHKERPIYGVQFLPEYATEEYAHGRKVLENFFDHARPE